MGSDMLPWASTMLAFNARPPDPGDVGRRLARPVARAPRRVAAVRRGMAPPPAARRLLAARLGLRGLRGHRVRRVRRRRPRRPVPQRDPAAARRPALPAQGADRAVGAHLSGRGATGSGDRLPAGDRAVLRALAEGRGERRDGRADAAGLPAGAGAAAPAYDERPGRWVGEAAWPSPRIRMREIAFDGPARSLTGSAGARRARRHRSWPWGEPADLPPDQRARGRALPGLADLAAGRPDRGARRPRRWCWSWRSTGRRRSSPCACATSTPTARRSRSRAACSTSPTATDTTTPRPCTPGERFTVVVPLSFTAHAFVPGRRVRVAVSPTWWPHAWPSPRAREARPLHAVALRLPERPPDPADARARAVRAAGAGAPARGRAPRRVPVRRGSSSATWPPAPPRVVYHADWGSHRLLVDAGPGVRGLEHRHVRDPSTATRSRPGCTCEWEVAVGRGHLADADPHLVGADRRRGGLPHRQPAAGLRGRRAGVRARAGALGAPRRHVGRRATRRRAGAARPRSAPPTAPRRPRAGPLYGIGVSSAEISSGAASSESNAADATQRRSRVAPQLPPAGPPARTPDGRSASTLVDDRGQVERHERARIDHLDLDPLGGQRLGRLERRGGASAASRRR